MNISVVIPIKNCNDPFIHGCMESLKKQKFNGTIEIIVVKGGNIAQARNFGITKAIGEIIAFIDSDCIAPDGWLQTMINKLMSLPDAGGIGGPNIGAPNSGLLSLAIDEVFGTIIGNLGSPSLARPKKIKLVKSLACINSVFWRKVLIEVGGFDEKFILNEDTNLSYRVRSKGYKLYFIPDSFVYHHRRSSFKAFSKQFYNYGVSRMRSMQTDLEYADLRIIILLSLFLTFPLIPYFMPFLGLSLLLLYFLIILSTGLYSAIKNNTMLLLLYVPLVFLIEHISYAIGLIWGITKGKWKDIPGNTRIYYHELLSRTE